MTIEYIDHVTLTVADVDRSIAFYERVLGATLLYPEVWRAGKMPVALIQVGGSRLSLHPAAAPAEPHARVPGSGSGDLCFRWSGSISGVTEWLHAAGIDIELGPVPRSASSGAAAQSVYFRDLDGNLLELLAVD